MKPLLCVRCGSEEATHLCSSCFTPYCSESCADADWEEHQHYCDSSESISYELFLPTVGILAKVAGPKNQVHQRITEEAVLKIESGIKKDYFESIQNAAKTAGLALNRDALNKLTPRRLIEGIIWNDLPSKRVAATGGKYPVTFVKRSTAERIVRSRRYKTKTIPGDRFRYNPSLQMLAKLAAVFARAKLAKLGVVKSPVNKIIYQSHFGDSAHFHSMAAEGRNQTVKDVITLIINQAIEWYRKAIRFTDIFFIANILHMIQDSYSRAHAIREPSRKGTIITKFQSFATQSPEKHAGADSMGSYENNPAKQELLSNCTYFLLRFRAYLLYCTKVKDRTQRKNFAEKQIKAMRIKMQTEFFATTPKYANTVAGGCVEEFCKTSPSGKVTTTSSTRARKSRSRSPFRRRRKRRT